MKQRQRLRMERKRRWIYRIRLGVALDKAIAEVVDRIMGKEEARWCKSVELKIASIEHMAKTGERLPPPADLSE